MYLELVISYVCVCVCVVCGRVTHLKCSLPAFRERLKQIAVYERRELAVHTRTRTHICVIIKLNYICSVRLSDNMCVCACVRLVGV